MLINQRSIPSDIPTKSGTSQSFTTTQGTHESSKIFFAQNIYFPDFCNKSRKIPKVQIWLFNSPNSRYYVIIGCDILKHGFMLDHLRNTISWDGLTISMTKASSSTKHIDTSFSCVLTATEVYTNTKNTILHTKYEKFSPQEVVNQCTHLSPSYQSQLLQLLSGISRLFPGTLGLCSSKIFYST